MRLEARQSLFPGDEVQAILVRFLFHLHSIDTPKLTLEGTDGLDDGVNG